MNCISIPIHDSPVSRRLLISTNSVDKASVQHPAGLSACCLEDHKKATYYHAAMLARMSDMTSQPAITASTAVTEQAVAVPTRIVQGVKTCAPADECVPNLAEIEEWVAPKLEALGVTRAMFEGEFVRASKWGDARLSDELGLVVFSDREFDEFYEISCEILKNHKLYI